MSTRRVFRPKLGHAEIHALFQAIGQVMADEMETWSDAEVQALKRASDLLSEEYNRKGKPKEVSNEH
jgi:hypothetical protein